MNSSSCGLVATKLRPDSPGRSAQSSGIGALSLFAQRLKNCRHDIVSRCRHRLNISVVEDINNTIKAIKRRAHGYRDQEYLFLKIRTASPGTLR